MLDQFLVGLIAGAVAGFAGVVLRLVQLAAVAGLGLIAWLAFDQGVSGLQLELTQLLANTVLPNARLLAGVGFGALLGRALDRAAAAGGR